MMAVGGRGKGHCCAIMGRWWVSFLERREDSLGRRVIELNKFGISHKRASRPKTAQTGTAHTTHETNYDDRLRLLRG